MRTCRTGHYQDGQACFHWSCSPCLLKVISSSLKVMVPAMVTEEFAPLLQAGDDPLLAPGITISDADVDNYARWLDQAVADNIRSGNFQITLGAPLDFTTHPRYVAETGLVRPGSLVDHLVYLKADEEP